MNQRIAKLSLLLGLLSVSLQSVAQISLAEVFKGLHSKDASVRENANSKIIEAIHTDMPKIEQYTDLLCSSLTDQDDYIRLQAAAILSVIAEYVPEHGSVVRSCSQPLIHATSDTAPRVRSNALRALAFNKSAPPPEDARPAFVAALNDISEQLQMIGTIGLLRMGSPGDYQNVSTAVAQAKTVDSKLALIRGIIAAGVKNKTILVAASSLLYDENPDVEQMAIEATTTSASSKAEAATTLQNFVESSRGSEAGRKMAANARATVLSSQ